MSSFLGENLFVGILIHEPCLLFFFYLGTASASKMKGKELLRISHGFRSPISRPAPGWPTVSQHLSPNALRISEPGGVPPTPSCRAQWRFSVLFTKPHVLVNAHHSGGCKPAYGYPLLYKKCCLPLKDAVDHWHGGLLAAGRIYVFLCSCVHASTQTGKLGVKAKLL